MTVHNLVQKRIQSEVEAQRTIKKMKEFETMTKNFDNIMEEIKNNEEKKYGKFQLLPNHQSMQAEYRNLNLLFSQTYAKRVQTLKKHYDKSNAIKIHLLDENNFDFNRYRATSPFPGLQS